MRASNLIPVALFAIATSGLAPFVAGCERADSAEDRQIAELQRAIGGIQDDNERFERRVTQNDHAMTDDVAVPHAPAQGKSEEDPKSIATAHVKQVGESSEDGQTDVNEDPDDATPRPSIHVSGYATRISRKSARAGGQERVEESNVDDADAPNAANTSSATSNALRGSGAASARPSALDPEAKPAYDAALSLVNHKQYAQALDAFAAFLVRWPDHPNADNAMYWRGECYFAQGDVAHANEQFEGLIARFPMGNKVPDALLKLGVCQQRLGNSQKAKAYFEQLAREYPRSEAARKIPADGAKREDKK